MFIASNLSFIESGLPQANTLYQERLLDHSYLKTRPNHGYLRAKKVPHPQVDEQFLENLPLQVGPKLHKVHPKEIFMQGT